MQNLIIKHSGSMLESGELKSNLGDLIRSTILLRCIPDDFVWISDSKGRELLKYFVPIDKIKTENEVSLVGDYEVYNLDNYIAYIDFMKKINGQWKGYIFNGTGVVPANDLIERMGPYGKSRCQSSWQQTLVEGLGFRWKEQDYAEPRIQGEESLDIGLNCYVHKEWTSKHWPEQNWKELERILKDDYKISWQQGLSNFDDYVGWINSCKMIVSCETLGLHLASALRKKVVAIVGAAENTEYSYGRVKLLMPKERECMPCNMPSCKFDKNCLSEISPEEVKKSIGEILRAR